MNRERHCFLGLAGEPLKAVSQDEFCLPDQNTQCTERRDQDGGRECVGGEVADFSDGHCDIPLASSKADRLMIDDRTCRNTAPPDGTLEVRVALALEAVPLRSMHQTLRKRHPSAILPAYYFLPPQSSRLISIEVAPFS